MIIENINKIDYELKNLFENVTIQEKSDRSRYYFEIKVSGCKLDEAIKECEVSFQIDKSDLAGKDIKWNYWSNPKTMEYTVPRLSHIDYITKDISDVVMKGRLDSDYLNSFKK